MALNNTDTLKNIDAEISVIGACLLDTDAAIQASSRLTVNDFTNKNHRAVWSAIQTLSARNEPIDPVTLAAEIEKQGQLSNIGGRAYLAGLAAEVPTAGNVNFYINLVRDCTKRRDLCQVGRKIASEAINSASPAMALDRAETWLMGQRETGTSGKLVRISDLMGAKFKELEELYSNGGTPSGLLSGFPDLDEMTCGFQGGDLIIIAGRPSMGKTALALNIAENAALTGKEVLFFSLEMSKELLLNRLLASMAKVDANRFRSGQFKEPDWSKLTIAAGHINCLSLTIDDRSDITALDVRSTARQAKRKGTLDLIVIDYLQLIRPTKREQIREREVAEISRSLKALAKEMNIPIIVLAQLNRDIEANGTPRRPKPSDLRESGSLEQDADLILFPWREAVYCEDCKKKGRDCGKGHYRMAEIIIGKQRNGPTGTVKANWLGEFNRFESSDIEPSI